MSETGDNNPDSARPLRGPSDAESGWPVAIAATLGMSVSYIDRQTLAAISPHVREALQIDHRQYGWLVSAFSMAYLAFAPLAGVLVDRLGARRGFAIAVAVWTSIAGLHAFAVSFATLFTMRLALGVSESPSFPAAAQAIRRALPGASRATAYGLLFTGSSIGGMIVAPVAVALDTRFGFRFAFLATAAAGTMWIPFWLFATRGGRLAATPLAAPATTTPAPRVSWRETVTSAPVLRTLVAVVGSAPALMFLLNFTPQYLVERWEIPRSAVGGYIVFPLLVFDLGAVGFGFLASRREAGPRRTHLDLMVLAATLEALLALATLAPSPVVAMILFSLSAAGGGGVYVLATADMLGRVPVERTSSSGGMCAAAQSLAYVVASPIVGWAIDRTHGYGGVLVTLGLFVIPTSFAFVLWPSIRASEIRPNASAS
ncbi:MAG TPA: MFS transporter [Labilithrix sp.]